MRAFLRCTSVVVPLVLTVVLVLAPAQAQFRINTFDTATADSMFAIVYNGTANATPPLPYHILSDDAVTKYAGAASLRSAWRMHTTETWGGLNMLSATLPTPHNAGYYAQKYRAIHGDTTYLDWAAGTHLSLWYNNAVPSNAAGNGVQMRFHIYEAGGDLTGPGSAYYTGDSVDYEDWYYQSPLPLNDANPGWHELIIPLVDLGLTNSPNDQGFSLTGWSGHNRNAKLDWDKIIGYTIEWTAGHVNPPADTASGIVYYDNLLLQGLGQRAGSASLYDFSNFTTDTTNFNTGWNNGGLSGITFRNETADTLLGPSVMGWDWAINVKEDWGGGANREYNLPASTFLADLSSKSELQLFCKVTQPLTSSSGTIGNKITMRFVLFDYSDGVKEEWYTIAPVRLDSVGAQMGWQMLRMPLSWIQSGAWGDLKSGRFNTPNGTKDGIMGLSKLGGFKIEFSSSRDAGEPFAPDLVYNGKILFTMLVPAGFKETDSVPPVLVTGVQGTPGPFQNLVTWSDVPGEPGATYTAYASEQPFTSADAAGVENIPPFGLPTQSQIVTHLLRAPNTDQPINLYYGVTATDRAGNTNHPVSVGPVTNTAKGVPTISLSPPASFAADGDVAEWSGIVPFDLAAYGTNPTAHVATNTTITDNADLSAKVYLAVDATYLYVAFDVTDNVISIDTSTAASDWLQDAPDLFIGLYDWRGRHHGGYVRGAQPDYHLRFSQHRLRSDNPGATVLLPGANYNFSIKALEPGYIVEARIPWSAFKGAVPADSTFVPVEGKRIPIDFEINDNDTPGNNQGREGMLCYAPLNQDNSYADVWRWTHTWIGNRWTVTGVGDDEPVALTYSLSQNYPNPFNPVTQIRFSLARAGNVAIRVYDILGREVATLVNDYRGAGEHAVTFNPAATRGGLASGVYFYRIESGAFRDVKKMMLLK